MVKRRKEDNLQPIKKGELSKEEATRRGSKGGKKSVQVRKQKKLLKETIQMLFNSKPTEQMINECANKFGFNPKDLQEVITAGLLQRAMAGDPKAFEVLRDTIGQKPVNVQEITGANGTDLVQKVYVTAKQEKAVKEHVQQAIESK